MIHPETACEIRDEFLLIFGTASTAIDLSIAIVWDHVCTWPTFAKRTHSERVRIAAAFLAPTVRS